MHSVTSFLIVMASLLNILSWTFLWTSLVAVGVGNPAKDKPGKKKDAAEKPLTTIAFGSGNQQNLPQPIWADVMENHPQLWIWLGGSVMLDSTDKKSLPDMYSTQLQEPGYSALREKTAVIGTWGNYEYGHQGAGKEYAQKAESQKLFWDFLGEAADSPLRLQQGVYSARTFGPKGKQVKIILLDTRTHRDPMEKPVKAAKAAPKYSKGKKKKDKKAEFKPTADLLGEAQWKWLEKEISKNTADLVIIGNSTPILPQEHSTDKWANYPKSRERLLKLVNRTPGVIFLSGERNMGEISSVKGDEKQLPLYEITSSGLTQTVERGFKAEPNRYRLGEPVVRRNFGLIKIDWDKRQAMLQVNGKFNQTYLSQAISF